MKHRDQILKLRAEGKTYNEIREITGASKSTICYHCGRGQKDKSIIRGNKYKNNRHPYMTKLQNFNKRKIKLTTKKDNKNISLLREKIYAFHKNRKTKECEKMSFSVEDLINKFGENPKCYLTGKSIDIRKPRTYHFDHIIPTSKGGKNTLDNLGICTKEANMSKTDHTVEEFINLCKLVLETNNYKVEKITE